jgi:hypothetical protein
VKSPFEQSARVPAFRPGVATLVSLWAVGWAVGMVGCSLESVDSSTIRTAGITATIVVEAPGDGTTLVSADLAVGGQGGTRVELTAPDRLLVTADNTEPTALLRTSAGHYEVSLTRDDVAFVSVQLDRDTDSTFSEVEPPPPFAMRWPGNLPELPTIDRSRSIGVAWSSASDGLLEWQVTGDCIWRSTGTALDNGGLTLPPETLRVRSTATGQACDVELILRRRVKGTSDPEWQPASSIEARQTRALHFISVPEPPPEEGTESAQ